MNETTIEFRNKIMSRLPDLKITGECAVPQTQQFWDYYKAHKQHFYDACLLVFRTALGEWRIKALDLVDRESVNQQKLNDMKAKHTLECPDCSVSVGICSSLMKDGRIMYQGYCPVCHNILTKALPHALVADYENRGLRIMEKDNILDSSQTSDR